MSENARKPKKKVQSAAGSSTDVAASSAKGKEKARYVDETSHLLSLASAASGNEEAIGREKLSKGQARAAKAAAKTADNDAKKKKTKIGKSKAELDKAKAEILAKQSEKKAKKRKASKALSGSGLSFVSSQQRKAVSFA